MFSVTSSISSERERSVRSAIPLLEACCDGVIPDTLSSVRTDARRARAALPVPPVACWASGFFEGDFLPAVEALVPRIRAATFVAVSRTASARRDTALELVAAAFFALFRALRVADFAADLAAAFLPPAGLDDVLVALFFAARFAPAFEAPVLEPPFAATFFAATLFAATFFEAALDFFGAEVFPAFLPPDDLALDAPDRDAVLDDDPFRAAVFLDPAFFCATAASSVRVFSSTDAIGWPEKSNPSYRQNLSPHDPTRPDSGRTWKPPLVAVHATKHCRREVVDFTGARIRTESAPRPTSNDRSV